MKSSEAGCDSTLSRSAVSVDECDKFPSYYRKEWEDLFHIKFYKEKLRSIGIKGSLQGSKFRSICWKIYLECLPEDYELWIEKAKSQRQHYEEILDKFHTNPRCGIKNVDINVNNPLSQSQQSPWNQYFKDTELKLTIEQDVVRTFPEIEFFQLPDVQKKMINILFLYAREYPHISYKQGMHELLAPIIFVLHHDQQTYLHASETEDLELSMHILLNQNYIEHDAFYLFCQLMEVVEEWYTLTECPLNRKQVDQEPFIEELCSGPNNNILGIKLKKIHQNYLKHFDPELFSYLEQMEITPQIYGIRWLRLLFGREFGIHDLLVIWDAIFADSIVFDLVNYIFVAMLICIRDLLIRGDYASSLNYLMRYPHNSDVRYIIDLALHLRDPAGCPKPSTKHTLSKPLQSKSSKENKQSVYKNLSRSLFPGYAKPVKQKDSSKNTDIRPTTLKIARADSLPSKELVSLQTSVSPESDSRFRSSSVCDKSPNSCYLQTDEKAGFKAFTIDHEAGIFNFEDFENNLPTISSGKNSYTLPRTMIQNVMESREHKFKAADLSQNLGHLHFGKSSEPATSLKEMVPLVPHIPNNLQPIENRKNVAELNDHSFTLKSIMSELSELRAMNQYCVQQMSIHIEKLQKNMVCQNLIFEDEMLVALAGIKRARDILKGTVNFTQEVIGDDINQYSDISNSCSNLKTYIPANDEEPPENLDFVVVEDENTSAYEKNST